VHAGLQCRYGNRRADSARSVRSALDANQFMLNHSGQRKQTTSYVAEEAGGRPDPEGELHAFCDIVYSGCLEPDWASACCGLSPSWNHCSAIRIVARIVRGPTGLQLNDEFEFAVLQWYRWLTVLSAGSLRASGLDLCGRPLTAICSAASDESNGLDCAFFQ
jgi:hypothetical protein